MATQITKAEFDTLPDSLKTKFKADGDNYTLIEEDTTGLVKNKNELLQELKDLKAKYGDIDADKAKEALAKLAELENADLAAKGKWEELEKKMREQHEAEKTAYEKRIAAMFETNAEKDLRLALAAKGANEDQVELLSIALRHKHIKPVEDNGNTVWKSLDDTQIIDLEKYIPDVVSNDPVYSKLFKSEGPTGSGSLGSGKGGGTATIRTATKEQVAKMTPSEKATFYKEGGNVTDFQ